MIRFYCESCGNHQEVEIEPIQKDNLNPDAWGDIVCKACHFVIATASADSEGELRFVPKKVSGMGGPPVAKLGMILSNIRNIMLHYRTGQK